MRYFEEIPTVDYPYVGKIIGTDDFKLTTINTVDMMIRFRIRDSVLRSPLSHYVYEWKDNDRPDIVARNYYGNANLAWLVMMSAMRFDALYDFPLSSDQFDDYIKSRYGSLLIADSTVHHYEDGEGDVIDETTYTASSDPKKSAISILKYEDIANESKRSVKLLSRKYLADILNEYENMLKKIKEARELLTSKQVLEG